MKSTDFFTQDRFNDATKWCIDCHAATNHMYDQYLPYEFHLRMVAHVADQWKQLIDWEFRQTVLLATWGHDLIEDTRMSYNDVKTILGEKAADIVYAVTNEKGKNRKERANEKYYTGIRETPGAVFVKLCDRIANVQYSKMTGSRMFEMYKTENENFINSLIGDQKENHPLYEMVVYLQSIFDSK
jgi:(p)ppGpp synthase/HD superfamily hydrolase